MTTFLISEDQTQTMEGRSKLKIVSQCCDSLRYLHQIFRSYSQIVSVKIMAHTDILNHKVASFLTTALYTDVDC